MNDRLAQIEALAIEVQEWLHCNEQGDFNICCQRCGAPFEHEGQAVAAPPEWYGGLDWQAELASDVLALIREIRSLGKVATAARLVHAFRDAGGMDWWDAHDDLYEALARLDSQ